MQKSFKTKGKMFRWEAEKGACWYFVYIDKDTSVAIKEVVRTKKTRVAFGSVRVEVTVGSSVWKTSIFPSSKDRVYMLPVKASIRKDESIDEGDTLDIELILV